MYRHLISLLIALAAVYSPGSALLAVMAQGRTPAAHPLMVESSILTMPERAVADGVGQAHRAPAVLPDMIFELAYRNAGNKPLRDVVLGEPLPKGVAYRAPAADSPAPELSVDGRTFGALSMLRVADGEGGHRSATADDVTHVRWRLPSQLAAGAEGRFAFLAAFK